MGLSVQTLAHTHFCGRRHNFPYIRYIPKKVFYLFIFFVLLAVSLCVLLIRRFRGGFWTHHVQKDVFLFGPVCRWETSDRVRWTNLLMTTLSFNRQPNCFTSVCPWRPRIFFFWQTTQKRAIIKSSCMTQTTFFFVPFFKSHPPNNFLASFPNFLFCFSPKTPVTVAQNRDLWSAARITNW